MLAANSWYSIDSPYFPWLVAGVVVLLALVVCGVKDLARFSPRRVWAISSVSFAESIRRRVLWITPLAILGVIVVSQLQHPVDEQDAIRQTTKFCLFACGLLVTVTAIILACTNLPREIESRVIYTVVTKPTTRLEIVVGKIIGFARVSAAILIIMGGFTYGYLSIRAAVLKTSISRRLEGQLEVGERATLEHYMSTGLLSARRYAQPLDLQIYSRLPAPNDERRYMFGAAEGQFIVPIAIPLDAVIDPQDPNGLRPLQIQVFAGYEKSAFEQETDENPQGPTTLPYYIQNPLASLDDVRVGPARASGTSNGAPTIAVEVLDLNNNTLVTSSQISQGRVVALEDPAGVKPAMAVVSSQGVAEMLRARTEDSPNITVLVQVTGTTPDYEYFANPMAIAIRAVDGRLIEPIRSSRAGTDKAQFLPPKFRTRTGTFGMQLRGSEQHAPMALFKFRNVEVPADGTGNIAFEMRAGVERSHLEESEDQTTRVEVALIDRAPESNGTMGPSLIIYPETNRPTYFSLPASQIHGKNFDVVVRTRSPQQFLGVSSTSLLMVRAQENFGFNLFKSLSVLWMLSMLVVIVSIFSSTFLSWPIAIVFTLLILLGHWGVEELGDAMAPGVGRTTVQDFLHSADPNLAKTVSTTVEALTKMLSRLAAVLPDISKFSAMEDLEGGVAVPLSRLGDSASVILIFGVPLMVLSYALLKHKEVAP